MFQWENINDKSLEFFFCFFVFTSASIFNKFGYVKKVWLGC